MLVETWKRLWTADRLERTALRGRSEAIRANRLEMLQLASSLRCNDSAAAVAAARLAVTDGLLADRRGETLARQLDVAQRLVGGAGCAAA